MEKIKNDVWETIQAMNRCWTSGNPSELVNYFHKNMVAITPTNKERLEGKDACVTAWSSFAKNTKIHFWKEIEPKIQLYGNTAIVTYYFDMSFDMGEQTINIGGRDMFTLVNEKGKWWIVADQYSPYPTQ